MTLLCKDFSAPKKIIQVKQVLNSYLFQILIVRNLDMARLAMPPPISNYVINIYIHRTTVRNTRKAIMDGNMDVTKNKVQHLSMNFQGTEKILYLIPINIIFIFYNFNFHKVHNRYMMIERTKMILVLRLICHILRFYRTNLN